MASDSQQQEMLVRWRHHQLGLLSYLRQMLASELFVDVTLCCQGRRLKAHRVLLSASSPYLQALLLSQPTNEHITIILHDVSYEDMRSLLDFIYTGGVTLPESRLPSFMSAAEALNITVLTDKHLHQTIPADDWSSLTYKTMPPLIKVDHDARPGSVGFTTRWNDVKFDVLRHHHPPQSEDTKFSPIPPEYSHQAAMITRGVPVPDDTKPTFFDGKPTFFDGKLMVGVDSSRCSSFSDSSEDSHRRSIDSGLEVLNSPSYDSGARDVKTKQEDLRFCCHSEKDDLVRMSRSPEYHQWVRPLPSLMPIGASAQRRSPRHSVGAILTPSPWAQNGRPPVGAPRRPPAEELSRSIDSGAETPDTKPPSPSQDDRAQLQCPPNHPRVECPTNVERHQHLSESDESNCYKNDVIKLCKLKERRLQDFYRDQRLNGQSDKTDHSGDALSLTTLKSSLESRNIPTYRNVTKTRNGFPTNAGDFGNGNSNGANDLHHISRILKVDDERDSRSPVPEAPSPLNGLKSIANILEDKSCDTPPPLNLLDRHPLLPPPSDHPPSINDSNNNSSKTLPEEATKFPCQDCSLVFASLHEVSEHLKTHSPTSLKSSGPPFTCTVCSKTFSQRGHFNSHQKLHQETRSAEHSCSHCGKVFLTRASLKVHLRTHTGEKPFHCNECGKQFSQLRNYKYHRSVHEGTKEFAATCPECGKYFNDRGYLSSHMKIHRNRKEYGCEYCGKSFNQRVAYNMHVRIHTGVKPHVCPHCSKSFSRKMLLKQHLRIHTGEKPFTCVVCQKAFADRSNMTLHMRLHSGVKPYTCSVCSKSFTKKHHLKTHMNYHTGVKPYACSKCGLRFSQSSNMRTHFKKCTSTGPVQADAQEATAHVTTPGLPTSSVTLVPPMNVTAAVPTNLVKTDTSIKPNSNMVLDLNSK